MSKGTCAFLVYMQRVSVTGGPGDAFDPSTDGWAGQAQGLLPRARTSIRLLQTPREACICGGVRGFFSSFQGIASGMAPAAGSGTLACDNRHPPPPTIRKRSEVQETGPCVISRAERAGPLPERGRQPKPRQGGLLLRDCNCRDRGFPRSRAHRATPAARSS